MAVDNLSCGQGGSTGMEIITRLNSLAILDPMASVRLAGNLTQSIPTGLPIPLNCASDVLTQRTGFVASVDVKGVPTLQNNSGVDFESVIVSLGLNVEIASQGDELEVYVYMSLDSGASWSPYSSDPARIQGAGTGKPVSIYWESDAPLPKGAMLQLWGDNGDGSTDADVTFLRTTFRAVASWRETMQVTP